MSICGDSVVDWLNNLRYSYENYDFISLNNNNNLNETTTMKHEQQQQQQHFNNRNSLNCDEMDNFIINYGNICRLSDYFSECVEEELEPIYYDCMDFDIPENVQFWRNDIRYFYLGEEDNILETTELIKNFDLNDDSSTKPQTPSFPNSLNDEEDEIELRVRRSPRPTRSQTFNFDITPSIDRVDLDLEIKGVTRITIGNEYCSKIKSKQKLILSSGNILIVGDGIKKLRSGVEMIKESAKAIGKKDVEIRDTYNMIYLLHFDNAKDVKYFLDCLKFKQNPEKVDKQRTVKQRLFRLLGKRSSRDFLESKGIIKNEPIFGNTLSDIYFNNNLSIPPFITKIIKLIELPQNIKSLGLYRASGNLAIIQKIRFDVDNGKLDCLNEYSKDVDVLTGALKLFFRELKEPLIPFDICQELLALMSGNSVNDDEIQEVLEHKLPEANREFLTILMEHLVKVCQHKDDNKMDIYNLSICWGPSLIAIPDACNDIVLQTSNVSKAVEYLLKHYERLENCVGDSQYNPMSIDPLYDTVSKIIELIEDNIKLEGIYKKSGSVIKIEKIMKKIEQGKLNDLNHYRDETYELCVAFKKYISTISSQLIPNKLLEIELNNKEYIDRVIKNTPKKDTLFLLLRHIANVIKNNKQSTINIINIWTITLFKNYKYSKLLEILLNFYGNSNLEKNNLPDLLLNEQLRESRYDNLPDINDKGEAVILDEKD